MIFVAGGRDNKNEARGSVSFVIVKIAASSTTINPKRVIDVRR